MEITAATTETQTKSKKTSAFKRMGKKMFSKRGQKVMLLVGLFALLGVTGYLNFTLNQPTPVEAGATEQANLFAMFRNNRSDERASNIAVLQSMVGNENYTAEQQENAKAQILELQSAIEFENATETLILAQNYNDAVVSKTGANINVLLKAPENITRTQASQIFGILKSCTPDNSLDIDNVFISVIQ
ncbi:MAG: SpoIIIAH-like family protein [Christensenellaceae bacterium]|jgi:hypothetical protein|nr:SpoIIIAH-like family protein [Christensenellaceae bacterium]